MTVAVGLVGLVALAYIGLLFLVADHGDRRARHGRSLAANPYVYALSLGVYCTAWTFYGSVGLAATGGVAFLPVYLGPTLAAGGWWYTYRKIIRISAQQRITSIADFISSRYGKDRTIGAVVAIIAVVGIVPYLALQLDAISTSFAVLTDTGSQAATAFAVAVALIGFAILFGTRHLDVTEHHDGLVLAIALESVVKLVAFLAAGIFVTFAMFDGPGDLFGRAAVELPTAVLGEEGITYWDWFWLTALSGLAVMFLPRQWQMAVVENQDEDHLNKAIWLFPLYLLVINVFVLPIAVAGRLTLPGVDADVFVLDLPLENGQPVLALFVFIGGLSAATSMVVVATVALSTMVSNDLVVPTLLAGRLRRSTERVEFSRLVLNIRRVTIAVIILAGYGYFRLTEGAIPLVSIGLISFAAIAQFAPSILGGIYWKAGNGRGALAGMVGGIMVWAYTLALPTMISAGPAAGSLVTEGPLGIGWLRPGALLGVESMSTITGATFWSLLVNLGLYVGVSLVTEGRDLDARQAELFVDAFRAGDEHPARWEESASVDDIAALLQRFLGRDRGREALAAFRAGGGLDRSGGEEGGGRATPGLVAHAERALAGALGAGSARVVIASLVREATPTPDEIWGMIDETSRVIAHSRRLEEQRRALETASAELRRANERLRDLDRMKDQFISNVTHELRTPLTSIRAFTEILSDNPDLDEAERERFLSIIRQESERLTRHINQVLDVAKIESGTMEWRVRDIDVRSVVAAGVESMEQVYASADVELVVDQWPESLLVRGDEDRLIQVVLNLLSNAVKFTTRGTGRVVITTSVGDGSAVVRVSDNGVGVAPEVSELIFQKFQQVADGGTRRPEGTGLGLSISRDIVEHLGGGLRVEYAPGPGATFCFTLPLTDRVPEESMT